MSLEASSPSQHSNSSASRPSLPFSQVMPSSKSSLAIFPLDMSSLTSPGTRPTIVPSSTWVFLFSLSAFTSFLTQPLSCILLSFTDFPSTSRAPRLSLFWKSPFAFGGISTTSSLCWWPMNPYLQPWTSTHGRLTSISDVQSLRNFSCTALSPFPKGFSSVLPGSVNGNTSPSFPSQKLDL